MSHVLTVACHTCEALGPMLRRSAGGTMLAARHSTAGANRSWSEFLAEHQWHDLRLLSDAYDRDVPIDGWYPRIVHGPPAPPLRVLDQTVACPNCRTVNNHPVTVDGGRSWAWHCRGCNNVWGPAAVKRHLQDTLAERPSTLHSMVADATRPTPS